MEHSWQLAQTSALAPRQKSDRLFFFSEELPQGARNLTRRYAPVEKLATTERFACTRRPGPAE